MAARSAQQRPLSHQALSTVCAECPAVADDRRSPIVVVRCCFQFPGLRRRRGCWFQQKIADPAVSDSLLPPSNPHRPKITDVLVSSSQQMRLRPQGPKTQTPSAPGINPWLQPGPDTYQLEFCRRGTCRRGTCQLGRSGRPAADEGGPQQRQFQQKPNMQSQRLRISTSKSPAVIDGCKSNPMLATSQ